MNTTPSASSEADRTIADYADVPYSGVADPETQIRGLHALAVVHGLDPAPVHNCRVLELGCAAGRNLLPQAVEFPDSQFVGIDTASSQIADGNEVAAQAGLTNVRLQNVGIEDIDPTWGKFNYILCPGVFSWVPPEIQDRILGICRANLAAQGIAVITYNVFPGWHFQNVARDLMRYHATPVEQPGDKINAARSILEFVAKFAPPQSVQGKVFQSERDYLRSVRDDYLYHDYLVDENRPMYFHEFADRAQAAGLQWLADTNPAKTSGAFVSQDVRKVLANVPMTQQCQLLDFIRNESFHKSLLCHQGIEIDWAWSLEGQAECYFILIDLPQPAEFNVCSPEPLELTFPAGKMATRDPLGKSALATLVQRRPQPTSLAALHDEAMGRISAEIVSQSGSQRSTIERVKLAMSGLLRAGLVKGYVDPPRFATAVSERPAVTSLNRVWAQRNELIVSQLHENIQLTAAEVFVVARLDGTSTREHLAYSLAEAIQTGQVTAQPAIRDCQDAVDQMLSNFAARAILSA